MASKAQQVAKLQQEIQSLETVNQGLISAKCGVEMGKNMTQKGYNLMDIVHQSIQREISRMKHERDLLSDIYLI